MPTTEDAIISAWLDAHGHSKLAWKVGHYCRRCDLYWLPDETYMPKINDLCPRCRQATLVRIPGDFLEPSRLLAAVEAWLLGDEENRLEIYPPTAGDGWVAVLWSEVGRFHYERKGQTLCEALRAALAAAMEAEQGESHGER